jgi:hypothetical protein
MVYLAIFSILALGFYSAVTTQVQVSYNDMKINSAQAAAESGMQFIRYQLSGLNIPHNTPNNLLFTTVYTQLSASMNGTANLGGDTVGMSGSTINIPSTSGNWINLDNNGTRFSAAITQSGQQLIVKVTGQTSSGQLLRAVQMNYGVAQRASAIFGYGVASRGWITMTGNTKILGASDPTKGSILAATSQTVTALSMTGNQQISGDASFVNPNAITSFSGNSSIAGYTPSSSSFASHIHKGVTMPSFPQIDTSAFLPYCTNTWTNAVGTSNVTLTNTILPSGTYSFSGNCAIKGILYVKTPAKITFSGNTTIQGCVVVENNPAGTPATNTMSFSGNVAATAIDTLPANGTFPAAERALTNSFLLAPNFSVSFTGNFGTVGGSLIADNFSFTGNAGGTVNGTVVGLGDAALILNGNADIIINSQGTSKYPSGAFFGNQYVPLADTYQEVLP